MINAFPHEPDQEVSVDTLIVMERHQAKVIHAQNGSHYENQDAGDAPGAFRNLSSR
jgi:hypothetical protein